MNKLIDYLIKNEVLTEKTANSVLLYAVRVREVDLVNKALTLLNKETVNEALLQLVRATYTRADARKFIPAKKESWPYRYWIIGALIPDPHFEAILSHLLECKPSHAALRDAVYEAAINNDLYTVKTILNRNPQLNLDNNFDAAFKRITRNGDPIFNRITGNGYPIDLDIFFEIKRSFRTIRGTPSRINLLNMINDIAPTISSYDMRRTLDFMSFAMSGNINGILEMVNNNNIFVNGRINLPKNMFCYIIEDAFLNNHDQILDYLIRIVIRYRDNFLYIPNATELREMITHSNFLNHTQRNQFLQRMTHIQNNQQQEVRNDE